MSTVLDTPERLNAWVLLSRISQCHLHMSGHDGLKVPGLAKWLKTNIPDCAGLRTVKDMYPRLLDYCDQFDISAPDGERCNYQVLITPTVLNGLYFDKGVFATMEAIETDDVIIKAYAQGRVVILRTMDETRMADRSIQMVKG